MSGPVDDQGSWLGPNASEFARSAPLSELPAGAVLRRPIGMPAAAGDESVSDLARRVLAAVAGERASYEQSGYEGPMPLHGMAGGAKWRVDGDDPDAPDWEGGYVCHCGDVFARPVEQGGVKAAFVALVTHQAEAGVSGFPGRQAEAGVSGFPGRVEHRLVMLAVDEPVRFDAADGMTSLYFTKEQCVVHVSEDGAAVGEHHDRLVAAVPEAAVLLLVQHRYVSEWFMSGGGR